MEYRTRKEIREKRIDPNCMADIRLLESPRKNVVTTTSSSISKETSRKRKRRIRRKI
jgi:hypothetical protein